MRRTNNPDRAWRWWTMAVMLVAGVLTASEEPIDGFLDRLNEHDQPALSEVDVESWPPDQVEIAKAALVVKAHLADPEEALDGVLLSALMIAAPRHTRLYPLLAAASLEQGKPARAMAFAFLAQVMGHGSDANDGLFRSALVATAAQPLPEGPYEGPVVGTLFPDESYAKTDPTVYELIRSLTKDREALESLTVDMVHRSERAGLRSLHNAMVRFICWYHIEHLSKPGA